MTHVFREDFRVLRRTRIIRQNFQDRSHVPNGNAFLEQIRQDFLNLAHAHEIGHNLVHQRLIRLLEIVHKVLRFLAPKDFRGMCLDDLREMRRQHGNRIHNRIAIKFRLFPLRFWNPKRRQPKGRLYRLNSRNLFKHRARVHCQIVVQKKLALGNLDSLQFDDIGIWLDLDVIANADGRYNQPQFQRALAPDHDNAVEEISTLACIDKRYQAVADFQFHGIDLEQRHDIFRFCCLRLVLGLFLYLRGLCSLLFLLFQSTGNHKARHGKTGERDSRKPWHNSQEKQHTTDNLIYAFRTEKLISDIRAQIALRGRTRDNDTGCRGNEQCRNLADKALTHGQKRVLLK